MPDVKLKVMEALQEEAYKGVVRIDSETMRKINVRPGDIVEIEGSKKTVAIIDRAYPADIGQSVIRMDGIMRRNAKTGIGERIIIKKAEIKEAKSITLAPAKKGVTVQADPEIFKRGLLRRAVVKGDQVSLGGTRRRRRAMEGSPFEGILDIFEQDFIGGAFGFSSLNFLVVDTNPKQPVIITENTEIKLNPQATEISEEKVIDVTYEDLGGLNDEIKKVREMIEIPLKYPEIFTKLGVEPPAGVLLHGPPGSGKTLLARAVANESDANFILINGPEIMNKFYGESEKRVRELFQEAEKNSPSIIFIDEIDAIAPKREDVHGEVERRVVSQLLTMMDGLESRGKVVVIGATNRPNALDPALRRPGRFDREIIIGVPDKPGRLNILKIHTRNMPLAKNVDLEEISRITHGFVGADLSALCKEAAMNVLREVLPNLKLGKEEQQQIPKEILEKLIVTGEDFKAALRVVRPSAMREVLVETPNISWEDVGGLKKIKQELIEAVEWPIKNSESFKRLGIRAPRGILLYGPPGTGKTLLAKAVAKESEANFILVNGPTLLNKWVGESEKGLKKIFEKARQNSPAIIFFDEVDSIVPRRGLETGAKVTERLVNTFLAEMDGLEGLGEVVVIAATNRPDILDPALLRPGRFDRLLLTSPPTKEARLEIFKIHTRKMPLAKDINLEKFAEKTNGYVGSDIESVCTESGLLALRADLAAKEIKNKYFEEALKKVKPSLPKETMDKYRKLEENYLSKARAAVVKEVPAYVG